MKQLTIEKLAIIARNLLVTQRGFTLDEFGQSVTENLWAVSGEGKQWRCEGIPGHFDIKHYLKNHGWPFGQSIYFGGWIDEHGVCYLDHTLVFQHKHTAVQEGNRKGQKAIFNLETKELLQLDGLPGEVKLEVQLAGLPGAAELPSNDIPRRFGAIAEQWARNEPAAMEALWGLLPEHVKSPEYLESDCLITQKAEGW